MMIEVDWWVPFIYFIKDQKLPPSIDRKNAEAARIIKQSKGYVLVGDKLYKRGSATGFLMKCVSVEEGKEILQKIHEGVCGNHTASRMLVGKVFRSGYYRPTALADAEDLILHVPISSSSAGGLMSRRITSSPYHHLGLLFARAWRTLTMVPGGFTHVLVAIDKFTKWIEYKPIAKIFADRVVSFIYDILHRFGFPSTIITDLGSNFHSHEF
jgi:hypothetical protein